MKNLKIMEKSVVEEAQKKWRQLHKQELHDWDSPSMSVQEAFIAGVVSMLIIIILIALITLV